MVSQLARWATWPCLALLAVLSLKPGPHMVRTGAPASLEHVIAYLLTGMIVAIGYGRRSMSLLALGALLSAYAGLLEIGQFWVGLPPLVWRGEIRISCRGSPGDLLHAGPCLGRSAVAQSRVQPLPIVEHLDVVEHRGSRLRTSAELGRVDGLRLERSEEALHRRIIETIAPPAHGRPDAVPLQHGPIRTRSVLHPTDALLYVKRRSGSG
jgi:hypothetical protein